MPLHRTLFSLGVASLADYQQLLDEYAVILVFAVVSVLMMAYKFAVLEAAFSGGESSATESKINCASCGARNTADSTICDYCDEPLPRQTSSKDG